MVLLINELLFVILAGFLSMNVLYLKFDFFKSIYHNKLKWHKPSSKVTSDGFQMYSICKHCGKRIIQDSQGNWF